MNVCIGKSKQITRLIEDKLNDNNNFILAEILLYFFENNSLIYFENILKKQNIDDEPLKILEDCIKVLDYYISKPEELASELKELWKLYCLGYIKTFSYTFIKMFEDENPKFKDQKKIMNVLNGNKPIYKMIRIYIYKIIYNHNENVFINESIIEKYKLKEYQDFDTFIKKEELINK